MLSNKPHPRTVENIETVFGPGYFDYVAGEQPGIPRKPDPAGVKLILDRFGVKPEECLYFGDTNTDMKTGLGAGLQTVGVTWGFRDRRSWKASIPSILSVIQMRFSDRFLRKSIKINGKPRKYRKK